MAALIDGTTIHSWSGIGEGDVASWVPEDAACGEAAAAAGAEDAAGRHSTLSVLSLCCSLSEVLALSAVPRVSGLWSSSSVLCHVIGEASRTAPRRF